MKQPARLTLAMHAAALCRAAGLRRIHPGVWVPREAQWMVPSLAHGCVSASVGAIYYPIIRSPEAYAVALHELGHIALGHDLGQLFQDIADGHEPVWQILAIEGEATAWAREHALPGAWTVGGVLKLQSYLTCAHDDLAGAAAGLWRLCGVAAAPADFLPPEDHVYWAWSPDTREALMKRWGAWAVVAPREEDCDQ
jgi:hypothetical protein